MGNNSYIPFDVYQVPLSNTNLVEASAGTGKTWTISGLYVRLILEKKATVDQILVVTYTKAATAELQDRIRKRLVNVLLAFETGKSEDEFCNKMLLTYGNQRESVLRSLTYAVGTFDQASIFTIHGFCQRLLTENAFESGADFHLEVLQDERQLGSDIVDDFWRQKVHTAKEDHARYLAEKKQSPTSLHKKIQQHIGKHFLEVRGVLENRDDVTQTMDELLDSDMYLKAMLQELLHFCNKQLEQCKIKARLLSYDDMLNRLERALTREGQSDYLIKKIHGRYRAVLIDEFQDTDPMQYRIFNKIYGDSVLPVFFVGDPKQAIYGFRGADVFGYIETRKRENVQHTTLQHNQRSAATLIHAVNTLFLGQERPFVFKEIPYLKVSTGDRTRPDLSVEGDTEGPFRFISLTNGEKIGKGKAEKLAAEITAWEIGHLLELSAQGKATLGDTPLHGGHIAVLVRKNVQGALIQRELQKIQIPSVQQGLDSVFSSDEAMELYWILSAIAEPGEASLLKAALTTRWMGYTARTLIALQKNQRHWEQYQHRFHGYYQLYNSYGFTIMFQRWFEASRIAESVSSYPGSERRLTNLRHLVELLQEESRAKPGFHSLLAWFVDAISKSKKGTDNVNEEKIRLRLDSDSERVEIVTIHKSKGLEYPVVFCPFLWDGELSHKDEEETVLFHEGGKVILDLGSPEQDINRERAVLEKFSEKTRVLYVALTRAIYRCYVPWGYVANLHSSEGLHTTALGWLLHRGPVEPKCDVLEILKNRLKGADNTLIDIESDLHDYAERAHNTVAIVTPKAILPSFSPVTKNAETLFIRSFRRAPLQAKWEINSFTSLTKDSHNETPDHDASLLESEVMTEKQGNTLFAFPKGAEAGSCLHAILEEWWDYLSESPDKLKELVQRKLKIHGFEEHWIDTIYESFKKLWEIPLNKTGLMLKHVSDDKRLVELEFTFSVPQNREKNFLDHFLDPSSGMNESFSKAAKKLHLKDIKGFIKGFIDLVFEINNVWYIIDYKSNLLGIKHSDYTQDHLVTAMAKEHYYLQYTMYTLALHKYLTLRQPFYHYETHFGGVFYLFLRGMDNNKKTGIFWDKPKLAFITALESIPI